MKEYSSKKIRMAILQLEDDLGLWNNLPISKDNHSPKGIVGRVHLAHLLAKLNIYNLFEFKFFQKKYLSRMNFFLLFSLFEFLLTFCSGAPTNPLIVKEQLALLDAELISAPKSSPNEIINLYSILHHRLINCKAFLSYYLPLEDSQKFLDILVQYRKIFRNFFPNHQ
jgi:hypothetical protein